MVQIKEEIVNRDLMNHEVIFRTAESESGDEDGQYYVPISIRDQVRSIWGAEQEDVKPKIERIDIDQNRQPMIRLDRDFLRKNFRENWIKTVKSTFRRPTLRKACQLCAARIIFDSAAELIDHYADLHQRETTSVLCKLCDFSGKTKEHILDHWKSKHIHCRRQSIDKYTVLKETNSPENIWIGDDELVHSIYPRKLKIYTNVEEREKNQKELAECKICLKKFTKNYLKTHMIHHDTEFPYTCDYCNKSFRLKQSIRTHMITHMNEKKFECKVCLKKFGYKQSWKMHEIIHFKGNLPEDDPRVRRRKRELELVECKICKAKVGRKSLVLHKRIHIKELPYKCQTCGKSFRRKSSLRYHMNTHLDKKPFACEQCPKTFGMQRSLEHHKLVHLKGILPDDDPSWKWADYKKKKVECDICFKTLNIYSLKDHKRIHANEKPFKCDVCNKSFRLKNNLRLHKMIHIDSEPKLKCAFCHYKFRTESYLKVHERLHREGMPACQFCRKEFSSNAAVLRHIRTEHFDLLRQQDKLTGELNELFQGNRTFECYNCNYTNIFAGVEKHMEKCLTEAKFIQCPKCVRKFSSKESCNNHFKLQHTDKQRTYECHICRYSTEGFRYHTLKLHLRDVHPYNS